MSTGPKIALAALLLLCLALRLAALDADPPRWLSWSMGLQTDEGFYTLDARHEALFGRPAPGDFHDRLLAPLLSALQQATFRGFGVGTVQARGLSVAFGLLTVAMFWFGLRLACGDRVAAWGALMLGVAPPVVFYNRLALQETPTAFWLVLAFALWAAAQKTGSERRRTAFLIVSGVCVGVALVFKALAIIALPAFLLAWWGGGPPPALVGHPSPVGTGEGPVAGRGSAPRLVKKQSDIFTGPSPVPTGEGCPTRAGGGPLALAGVLLLYGLLWYVPHHAELARMAGYYRTHQFEPHSMWSVWLNIRRGCVDAGRGLLPYLIRLMPVTCLLALATLWGKPSAARGVLGTWLGGGLAFCLLSSYAPDRYYVLFYPALAGLAALGAVRLPRFGQAAALALFLATSGFWYARDWAGRGYARRDAAQALRRTLPVGSVLVGEMAPALALDTPFAAAPVQPGLSNDKQPVARLGATHILMTRTPSQRRWWQAHDPAAVQPSRLLMTLPLRDRNGDVVDVYRAERQDR